jgi:hypothetical protein
MDAGSRAMTEETPRDAGMDARGRAMQGAIADAAPERHYDVPPRPAPVETDFGSNNEPAWSAPEPTYPDQSRVESGDARTQQAVADEGRDARARATPGAVADEGRDARGRATPGAVAEPAAAESGAEPVVSSDERQAS